MRLKPLLLASCIALTGLSNAAQLEVTFELPDFSHENNVRRPYVAIWAEQGDESTHFLLWHLDRVEYDRWLPDLRRWWRKIGRYDAQPDALTGATRGAGKYSEVFELNELTEFTLFLEVVREHGGRSLVSQSIRLEDGIQQYQIPAEVEIGSVTINITH